MTQDQNNLYAIITGRSTYRFFISEISEGIFSGNRCLLAGPIYGRLRKKQKHIILEKTSNNTQLDHKILGLGELRKILITNSSKIIPIDRNYRCKNCSCLMYVLENTCPFCGSENDKKFSHVNQFSMILKYDNNGELFVLIPGTVNFSKQEVSYILKMPGYMVKWPCY